MNESVEVTNNLEAFLTVNLTMNCAESEEQRIGCEVDTDTDGTRELRHKRAIGSREVRSKKVRTYS